MKHVMEVQVNYDPHMAKRQHGLQPEYRLYGRFAKLIAAIMAIACVTYLIFSSVLEGNTSKREALLQARAIDTQQQASWDYVNSVQDRINYDADGTFNFKGVYCASAARQIAELTNGETSSFSIRYVRVNPRKVQDTPDSFELKALEAFKSTDVREYYGIDVVDRRLVFRYVSKLTIEEGCLTCHGSPAGARDVTGSYKEGKSVGDVGGARSIIVSLEESREAAMHRALRTTLFFVILLLLVVASIQYLIRHYVITPVSQANSQLAKANEQLKHANQMKGDFLALVSHEMKTPLSSIIAFTDIWEASDSPRDERDAYAVEQVKLNSIALSDMVGNVIDSARVDAGKYPIEPEEIDVLDIFSELKAQLSAVAASRGIDLCFRAKGEVPIVISDWDAIHTILSNLVGNALKFTPAGGSVVVCARSAIGASGEDIVEITVSDTGCGIPKNRHEAIFERFEQARQAGGGHVKGSGLGLSLARTLADMLGGSIRVESEPGQGSTFTLTLAANGLAEQEE